MDQETGVYITGKKSREVREMASLTKIMTFLGKVEFCVCILAFFLFF